MLFRITTAIHPSAHSPQLTLLHVVKRVRQAVADQEDGAVGAMDQPEALLKGWPLGTRGSCRREVLAQGKGLEGAQTAP